MKPSFGAKSAKSCLPSTHWIVANHKIEGAVSASVAGANCRLMQATTIELRGPNGLRHRPLGRDRRAIGNIINEIGFVSSNRMVSPISTKAPLRQPDLILAHCRNVRVEVFGTDMADEECLGSTHESLCNGACLMILPNSVAPGRRSRDGHHQRHSGHDRLPKQLG
jgi:hypothetical protein